jgi:aspartyl-tRNA synthetase
MLKRTHRCGELRADDVGSEVIVSGWVSNWRDHGGVVFIDLRDRTGLLQIVFKPDTDPELHAEARDLRAEFCISVRGVIERRPGDMENPKLPTGQVEMVVQQMEVHSEADTPPFEIDSERVSDEIRMRYRYLDLRRPNMQRNLEFRSNLMQTTRNYLSDNRFIEVETPFLTRSTPEGARDYLVPSRVNPGSFYALPQSPQLFKQLLMVGGLDRYFQIVKCFRDEDLRANRQPEFTQIDLEMSFVDMDDVLRISEGLVAELFSELLGQQLELPLPRLDFHEAMDRYGTDAPDLRFGLEIEDVSDIVADCEFRVFSGTVEAGNQVRGICVPGGANLTRKVIDDWVEWIKQFGAGGLAWFKLRDGQAEGGVSKFLSESEISAIADKFDAEDGALFMFVADRRRVCDQSLSHLRKAVARELDLIPEGSHALCCVVNAPAFEHDEETGRLTFLHHPFTMPFEEDVDRMESDPTSVRTHSYDIVMDGQEIGGGSIRINDYDLQMRVLDVLGYEEDEAKERFGFLLDALRYGAPPHGGLAFGMDRLTMCLLGTDDLREVIAFPKTQKAVCLLSSAPSPVDPDQLHELGIHLDEELEE